MRKPATLSGSTDNTLSPQAAAIASGYPAMLFGYTPKEKFYWSEPGLRWYAEDLNTPGFQVPKSWQRAVFASDVMAPRFTKDTIVVIEPVAQGEAFAPGVYVWHPAGRAGKNCEVGRLLEPQQAGGNALFLSLDNAPHGIICLLEWDKPDFELFRVISYSSVPAL